MNGITIEERFISFIKINIITLNFIVVLVETISIEDITRVGISYEMTTCVKFFLSYDLSKELFIAFKVDNISTNNALLSRTSS